ncbi:MAG: hypothetical protein AAFU79_13240 [Myxococcota bacterium]
MSASSYPPVENLIPHEPPMVWLDALEDWAPGRARCTARVDAASPFVDHEGLPAVVLLEHMAQAVAVCLGYGALLSGESVRVGMVIACRVFDLYRSSVALGTVLDVAAHREREVDEVSNYACEVHAGEELVARARLTLYHASEPPS